MPYTLTEAAKLTRNMLVKGVIETLITESSVLRYLPFVTINGSGMDYNREATAPSVDFYDVGDTWTESTGTFTKVTTTLKILGGDADIDQFIRQTYSSEQNIEALMVQSKAKAMAMAFNDHFFNGNDTTNPKEFDGLAAICGTIGEDMAYSSTSRAQSNGANGAVLTLDVMDQFIDAIKPGKPDVLFMSKRSRRKLSSLRRAAGNMLETNIDNFGRRVVMYDGIPIEVDENIADTETQGTSSGVCSSIYAVKFGFKTGVCGLQNGGIQVEKLGELETKDASRTRIKWYVGLAAYNVWSYARLAGVKVS